MNSYKDSGVDIIKGYEAIDIIKQHAKKTNTNGVLSNLGAFSGLFSLKEFKEMDEPVLASGTDGVGTKLKIAFLLDKHDTIGIDCVAYSVNDIICSGAKPIFFLDYIACDKVIPEKIGAIVAGISEGCMQADCALIGGETAEMPGFYSENEYDLAGMAVGIVDKKNIITGSKIGKNTVLLAIASSGLHSNGYSLVRKLLNPTRENMGEFIPELGKTLGEELLEPTRIYAKTIQNLINSVEVQGICNITGGGFTENIPRMFPAGFGAKINTNSWTLPPIFEYLKKIGNLELSEMFEIFNMGVGMVVAIDESNVDAAISALKQTGDNGFVIGCAVEGIDGVEYA